MAFIEFNAGPVSEAKPGGFVAPDPGRYLVQVVDVEIKPSKKKPESRVVHIRLELIQNIDTEAPAKGRVRAFLCVPDETNFAWADYAYAWITFLEAIVGQDIQGLVGDPNETLGALQFDTDDWLGAQGYVDIAVQEVPREDGKPGTFQTVDVRQYIYPEEIEQENSEAEQAEQAEPSEEPAEQAEAEPKPKPAQAAKAPSKSPPGRKPGARRRLIGK